MKKIISAFIVLVIIVYFILAPSSALNASRNGLVLWFEQLLPTLLPFSIISYVVLCSNLFMFSHKPDRHTRRISGPEWYIIFCGFLFGFPIGSKLTADCYRQGQISKKNASILCCFTNNLSPVFVTAVLREQLGFPADLLPYILLYGIPLLIGLGYLFLYGEPAPKHKKTASRFQLNMQIVDAGIINGFETLIKICGYIMMFSILSEILKSAPFGNQLCKVILIGCTEVTNGIAALSLFSGNAQIRYLLTILFLSWNGISGLFQTASILCTTDLSVKQYLKGKLLLVILTTVVTGILLFFRFSI